MGDMTSDVEDCARTLWDYLTIDHSPEACFALFVLGRDDINIARQALQYYTRGLTSILILVGGRGRMSGSLTEPESRVFRRYLLSNGVPDAAIIAEEESTNTSENIREGLSLLPGPMSDSMSIGLVTHAPHSRRALATATFQAPAIRFLSYPDGCACPAFGSEAFSMAAAELVGEVDRLLEYPQRGYPIAAQRIPPEVMSGRGIVRAWLVGL